MKKNFNRGFMLAETLIVTTFVAGVLIFLFIQFTNLSENYNDSYKYNTIEGIYSLRNIENYITSDLNAINIISEKVTDSSFLNITDCEIFTEKNYCLKLFELENIKKIFISPNDINKDLFDNYDMGLKKFINRIDSKSNEKYRIIVEFNDSTYATIRFGD